MGEGFRCDGGAHSIASEEEIASAENGADVFEGMTRRYPDAGMDVALQIGAKLATDEMK